MCKSNKQANDWRQELVELMRKEGFSEENILQVLANEDMIKRTLDDVLRNALSE